jgi:predicted alpha/beta superfamily hydrolase
MRRPPITPGIIWTLCTLAAIPGAGSAQQLSAAGKDGLPRQVTIADTERHEIASSVVGDVFNLHVYLPRVYEDMTDPLPVVYLLDAEYSFGAAAYIVRRLIKDGLIPPVLLVGVAYEVPYEAYYARRERDFTPTAVYLDDFPHAGHAASFARALREEMIPFVNKTYRVDPNDRTIMGLSFSGLFATYLLFKEPGLFNRYVITSPSLWWDDGIVFRYEGEYRETTQALPAHVYFAAGEDDGPNILRDLGRMENLLATRQYRDLDYRVVRFPDETHRTVFPLAISHGLRFLFGSPTPEARPSRAPTHPRGLY